MFLARDLYEHRLDSGEQERIEIVRWPLADLDGEIAAARDSKTIAALLAFARRRGR